MANYNDDNYETLAIKYNLPVKVIKAIIESQFELTAETIKNYNPKDKSTHKNIRLIHLGLLISRKLKTEEDARD